MLYAILCYHYEDVVTSWTKEEDDQVMGASAWSSRSSGTRASSDLLRRLLPTTAATTLTKDRETPLVIDGPFAETKEQLLGFYIIDASIARGGARASPASWPRANPGGSLRDPPGARSTCRGPRRA